MAILSDPDRLSVWAEFMRDTLNINNGASGLTKAQLRAAVDAIDQWNEDNQSAFNLAIPQPARGALTTKQKASLQMAIVAKRWLVS
jgi:hypothetical protein